VESLINNRMGHKVLLRMEFDSKQIVLTDAGDVWFMTRVKSGVTDLRTLVEKPMRAAVVLGEQGYGIGLEEIETFLAKAVR
jgi:hypothetical protein